VNLARSLKASALSAPPGAGEMIVVNACNAFVPDARHPAGSGSQSEGPRSRGVEAKSNREHERRGMKKLKSQLQAPEKVQTPNLKHARTTAVVFGAW